MVSPGWCHTNEPQTGGPRNPSDKPTAESGGTSYTGNN